MALARPQHRTLADHPGPAHLIDLAGRVGDDPVARLQLDGVEPEVEDLDIVGPDEAPRLRVGIGGLVGRAGAHGDVAGARLVQRGAAGRLDAPGQPGAGQGAQDVVHRLRGDGVQPGPDPAGDLVDLQVTALGENLQHGQARLGHA